MENLILKKEENKFYVYVYLDTRKPGEYIYFDDKINLELKFDYEPFYIGKGCGDRMFDHLSETIEDTCNTHKVGKIKHILNETGEKPIIFKIEYDLFEKYSLSLERKYIKAIGRSDLKKGPLTNQTDGGDGPSNQIVSDETKEKLRIINTGKKQSKESIAKRVAKTSGDKHYLFGQHLTEETKEKLRISKTGTKTSEETKNKQRIAMTGKKASEEAKTNMSKAQKGKFVSKETREKQRQAKLGTKQSAETIAKRIKSGNEHWGFGKERSQETKNKISKSNKGKPSWNKGIPCSEEVKEKSRQKQLGKKLSPEHVEKISKNNAKFWLGKTMTKEHIESSKKAKRENCEININDINYKEKLSKSHSKTIIQYDREGNFIQEWESIKKAQDNLNISQISACCNGKRKSAGGFIWKHKY